MSTKDVACSAGRSLVERLCDGCRRRADGWTEGYAGSVVGCVWQAEGWAGASIVKWLAVAAACGRYGIVEFNVPRGGVRQSASRHSTTESHRRTTRPAPWYSLCRSPVPANPSVPITLPCSFPPPTQASRAATDVSLFNPPAPPGSGTDQEIVSPHARVTSNRHRHRDFFSERSIVIDRSRLWRNRNNTTYLLTYLLKTDHIAQHAWQEFVSSPRQLYFVNVYYKEIWCWYAAHVFTVVRSCLFIWSWIRSLFSIRCIQPKASYDTEWHWKGKMGCDSRVFAPTYKNNIKWENTALLQNSRVPRHVDTLMKMINWIGCGGCAFWVRTWFGRTLAK